MEELSTGIRWSLLGCLLAVGLSACKSGPQAYDIEVSLDRNSFPPGNVAPMYVDLVLVTEPEMKRDGWSGFSIDEYLEENTARGKLRKQFFATGKAHRLAFDESNPGPHKFQCDDLLWEKRLGQGATSLVIIADLPGITPKPGEEDPRRLVLPLDYARWKCGAIQLQLTDLNVDLITPMLSED